MLLERLIRFLEKNLRNLSEQTLGRDLKAHAKYLVLECTQVLSGV
jgi:hypothetical protein